MCPFELQKRLYTNPSSRMSFYVLHIDMNKPFYCCSYFELYFLVLLPLYAMYALGVAQYLALSLLAITLEGLKRRTIYEHTLFV